MSDKIVRSPDSEESLGVKLESFTKSLWTSLLKVDRSKKALVSELNSNRKSVVLLCKHIIGLDKVFT